MTSDVVGVGSVGQVPDCAVGVLCWPMNRKIQVFCWSHNFFLAWLGQFLRVKRGDVWEWVLRSHL